MTVEQTIWSAQKIDPSRFIMRSATIVRNFVLSLQKFFVRVDVHLSKTATQTYTWE